MEEKLDKLSPRAKESIETVEGGLKKIEEIDSKKYLKEIDEESDEQRKRIAESVEKEKRELRNKLGLNFPK